MTSIFNTVELFDFSYRIAEEFVSKIYKGDKDDDKYVETIQAVADELDDY
jgi:hypothetical protein